MKTLLWIYLCFVGLMAAAQTKVEKTIPIKAGQQLVFNADYPELKIQTWDKNEVLITGTVSINRGEHDQAFDLRVESSTGEVTITSLLKDKENIPQRIVIKKGDQEYFFKSGNYNDPEIQKFLEANGREYSYMSNGIIQEIKLTVFVPKNIQTTIRAKYGLVEVLTFEAPLVIEAKYGGIDVTISPQLSGQLTARSQYGEILTNLDNKFDRIAQGEKSDKRWTEISANLGKGPRYSLESKYGNVYLRKQK